MVDIDTGQKLPWPRCLHQQPLRGLFWGAAQRAAPGSHRLSSSWTRASAPQCLLTWLRRVSERHPLCHGQQERVPELLWDSQSLAGGAVSFFWVWRQNNGLRGALVPTLRIVTTLPDVAKARIPHALTGDSHPGLPWRPCTREADALRGEATGPRRPGSTWKPGPRPSAPQSPEEPAPPTPGLKDSTAPYKQWCLRRWVCGRSLQQPQNPHTPRPRTHRSV